MPAHRFLEAVVSQHAEEAAFLWVLRDRTVLAPHHTLAHVVALDERIEAHLDGLRVAGAAGWEACAAELRHQDGGEAFAAGVLAFESAEIARIQPVLETAPRRAMARGIVSALAWVPIDVAAHPIQHLLASESPVLQRIGIAAAACHRFDPGDVLRRAVESDRPALAERACRAAGELGRADLLPLLRARLDAAAAGREHAGRHVAVAADRADVGVGSVAAAGREQASLRFAAAWAAGLLGDRSTIRILGEIAAGGGPHAADACALGVRLLDEADALGAHDELAARPDLARIAIAAASAAAYPSLVPWLLEQMEIPHLARLAAEAFSTITGLDLVEERLDTRAPDGFEAGPTEDPADENVDPDPDEHLPWPLVDGVRDWWDDYRGEFYSNARYLLGNPITIEWLDEVLRIGHQRHRTAAALEMVIKHPGTPLFEARAPGARQRALVADA